MAIIFHRTPTGRLSRDKQVSFGVYSGSIEIVDGKSTGKIAGVTFAIGDQYVKLTRDELTQLNEFVQRCEKDHS